MEKTPSVQVKFGTEKKKVYFTSDTVVFPTMKRFILREYGSWTVLLLSYLVGVGGGWWLDHIVSFVGLSLLVNSKQALTTWWRGKKDQFALLVFIFQVISGCVIILFATGTGILWFLPWGVVPLLYTISLLLAGEHKLKTEILGFATLTLSVLPSEYISRGGFSPTLYVATALFFTSGVFKVRVHMRKGKKERLMMIAYLVCIASLYTLMGISPIILLPLSENLLHALGLYRQKLRTVGWMEVLKGVAFVLLMRLNTL